MPAPTTKSAPIPTKTMRDTAIPEYTLDDLNHVIFNPGQYGQKKQIAPRTRWQRWFTIEQEIDTAAEVVLPSTKADDEINHTLVTKEKNKWDRALDWAVERSGSIPVFIATQSLLWAWALMAIEFHTEDWWQVVISDAQAIYSYTLDSIILHQQLLDLEAARYMNGQLASRNESKIRMLTELLRKFPAFLLSEDESSSNDKMITMMDPTMATQTNEGFVIDGEVIPTLPTEKGAARIIRKVALVFGHLGAVAVFWLGFVIWMANGPGQGWSDEWQLYYNSACSAFMVFEFSLLCVTTETYAKYRRAVQTAIKGSDRAIERKLRTLTGDTEDNPTILLKLGNSTRLQSYIEIYAYIVGTLIGLAVLVIVIIMWICIGPPMEFNANWWLIIGTYAGLIGLHDSFVLRYMQMRIGVWTTPWIEAVRRGDEQLTGMIDPASLDRDREQDATEAAKLAAAPLHVRWTNTTSAWILKVCAHEWAVVADVILIVGLLCGSTALKWSVTGQLISNVPPGTLESFLMQILITGLNAADKKEQKQLKRMYDRRLGLLMRLHSSRALLDEYDDGKDLKTPSAGGDVFPSEEGVLGGDEISIVPNLPRTTMGQEA